ncbi:fumarylacetoacetate hydrolase family protein [Amycolatopsis echigonensis]|uniref:2-keto-4-pentenoate hydratase/2-oxohepta-3-ene-1,7-dioic acid hydratase in catechol pathway n=1 Tax=Amycolatopsis echigonensis TaxID=2576905 RepID=A0A2N3WS78_9PSEU|nr:fumarylacetoacetate hydrolase family protein [Amycolatopsis niigatensis]PKV96695.1 2-keto-4-pentenoate hydratase/2-oxohepta-3-ene-1,7-dioic acid hydratase in catechol pathway [Amycolatopsis niigatensis]
MRIANLAGRLVLLTDDGAVDVERASGQRFPADPHAVYARWEEFTTWAADLAAAEAEAFDEAALQAPSPAPNQVFGVGLNYRDHAAEAGLDLPDSPTVFTKFPSCLTGPSGEIALTGPTVDWEVELVAVIGRAAHRVPVEHGWDHVAGLTVGQDLSDRTLQLAGPAPQFSLGKSAPGFGPTGPWLVTPDEFADPDNLALSCEVNGESVQKSRTSELVFSVPELVARLSAILPLLPGDLIFTGTPAGVGMARTPQRFLAAGDELVSAVEGIGTMHHRFTEPS